MKKHNTEIMLRRRARSSDDVQELNTRFLAGMSGAEISWWDGRASIGKPVLDGKLESQVDISAGLRRGDVGHVAYVHRGADYLQDKALFDDRLVATFRFDDAEYADFVNTGFRHLLEAFTPYRAQVILDQDLALDDWEVAVARCGETGKDADGRDGMIRFWPVAFMDEELCRRSLGMSPDTVATRLAGNVERVELCLNGVLVVATTKFLELDGLVETDRRIRTLLG